MIQVTKVRQVTNVILVLMTVLTLRIGPATGQASSSAATGARCGRRCAVAEAARGAARPGTLVLDEPDEDKRADLAEALAEKDAVGALDFLLALLDTDPSADVRENIVDELEDVDDPRVDPALERRVLVDRRSRHRAGVARAAAGAARRRR